MYFMLIYVKHYVQFLFIIEAQLKWIEMEIVECNFCSFVIKYSRYHSGLKQNDRHRFLYFGIIYIVYCKE